MFAVRRSAALPVAFLLALAACGGDAEEATDDAADGDRPTLTITSTDDLKFDQTSLTAPAGKIRFEHENDGSQVHTFVIEGTDFKLVDDDGKSLELAAGEYTFYCDVSGHREAGMEGTLTVTP